MADPTCSVEDCVRPLSSRGMCKLHYERKRMAPKRGRDCGTCGARVDGRRKWCSDECRPTCSFSECSKPVRALGLCSSHCEQRLRKGRLAPISTVPGRTCRVCGSPVATTRRGPLCSAACQVADRRHEGQRPTEWRCPVCERSLSLGVKNGRLSRADTLVCADCTQTPAGRRYRYYKVTPAVFEEMCAIGCLICGDTEKLHIDHDHACCPSTRNVTCGQCVRGALCGQCVRGALCGNCNRALGLFRDDINRLQSAIDYLKT